VFNIIFKGIISYFYDPNEESKAAKYVTLVNETIPYYMERFENIVVENNGYFVNGKVNNVLSLNDLITYLFVPNLIIKVIT